MKASKETRRLNWVLREQKRVSDKKAKNERVYGLRRERLSALGYPTYKSYLGSDLWKGIREKILPCQCRLCANPAKQIHHLDYETDTLQGIRTEALIPVCGKCHRAIEFSHGNKRDAISAAARCKTLLARRVRSLSRPYRRRDGGV